MFFSFRINICWGLFEYKCLVALIMKGFLLAHIQVIIFTLFLRLTLLLVFPNTILVREKECFAPKSLVIQHCVSFFLFLGIFMLITLFVSRLLFSQFDINSNFIISSCYQRISCSKLFFTNIFESLFLIFFDVTVHSVTTPCQTRQNVLVFFIIRDRITTVTFELLIENLRFSTQIIKLFMLIHCFHLLPLISGLLHRHIVWWNVV